ncbi:MAG: nuclear transport factor 2 family protein, partial [Pseudomonadota bacterium]
MANPDEQSLLAAEEARRQAMLAGDTARLQHLLADTLMYTHSTGVKDDKQTWLQQLSSGALVYEKLEFEAPDTRVAGQTGLVN